MISNGMVVDMTRPEDNMIELREKLMARIEN